MATQIGVQMYTIRDYCKTPADIAKSCKRIKDMGYGAVQASALGPIEASELRKILDDHGLVCAATHRSLDQLKDVDQAVEYHQTLGCELTAIGGFGFGGASADQWKAFIQDYNQIGPKLAAKGLKVGYHNHSHEFHPLSDDPKQIDPKNVPMQWLLDGLSKDIWFEIDTYWIQHGGADPAQWIEKVSGRIPALHCKDIGINAQREHMMLAVGTGNLNWPRILDAAKKAGVQWYLVERDKGDLDPFESLKISYDNLRSWGLE